MTKLQLHYFDTTDLLAPDAGYALGWISIAKQSETVNFFDNQLCMVFTTFTSLIEFVSYYIEGGTEQRSWVGDSNGKVYRLSTKNGNLVIEDNTNSSTFSLQELRLAIIEWLATFNRDFLATNPHLQAEAAITGLLGSIRTLTENG